MASRCFTQNLIFAFLLLFKVNLPSVESKIILNSDSDGSSDLLIMLENQSEGGNKNLASNNDPGSSCDQVVEWTNNENCVVGPVSIRENVAEDVFRQLCPKPTGRFQAPSSCDLYITCHFESLTINKCPEHFHFDESQQKCVEAELYECSYPVAQEPRKIFERGNSKRQALFNINDVTHEVDYKQTREADEDGEHVPSKRFANCPESYVSPHPYDCATFQICSNNRIFNQKCGPGTLFNPLSLVCDHANNVDCSSRMSDYGTYDCQPEHKYVTSHFDDCTKFIECSHGSLKIKSCSQHTVFNPEKGTCDFKYRTKCQDVLSFEHDTDVNHFASEENFYHHREVRSSDLRKYVCEFNYIAPVEGVCNEFIECENKRIFKKTCGPGTAYNPLLGQCDWPFKVRTPNPDYCAKYFQCDGRYLLPRECPVHTFFNAFSGKCELPDKVDCNGKLDDPNEQITLSLNRS